MQYHRSPLSWKESFTIIEPVNEFYHTALDYRSFGLPYRSQQYDGDMTGQIAKVARRLKVQLKLQMYNSSN